MNVRGNQKRNTESSNEIFLPASEGKETGERPRETGVSASAENSLRLLHLLGIAFLTVFLDQLTKWIVVSSLYLHESHTVVPRILSITRIHNTGIAFGLFPGMSDVLMIVTLVSIIVVFYFYLTLEHRNNWITVACGLIIGGAMGNLLDRFRLGYVVDFIYFSFWPAFNVADSSVSVGVGILMIGFFLAEREAKKNAPGTA